MIGFEVNRLYVCDIGVVSSVEEKNSICLRNYLMKWFCIVLMFEVLFVSCRFLKNEFLKLSSIHLQKS